LCPPPPPPPPQQKKFLLCFMVDGGGGDSSCSRLDTSVHAGWMAPGHPQGNALYARPLLHR
jgi:hypothetical protein